MGDVMRGVHGGQPYHLDVEPDRGAKRLGIEPADAVVEHERSEQLDPGHQRAYELNSVGVRREDALEHQAAVADVARLRRDVELIERAMEQARHRMQVHVDDARNQLPIGLRELDVHRSSPRPAYKYTVYRLAATK